MSDQPDFTDRLPDADRIRRRIEERRAEHEPSDAPDPDGWKSADGPATDGSKSADGPVAGRLKVNDDLELGDDITSVPSADPTTTDAADAGSDAPGIMFETLVPTGDDVRTGDVKTGDVATADVAGKMEAPDDVAGWKVNSLEDADAAGKMEAPDLETADGPAGMKMEAPDLETADGPAGMKMEAPGVKYGAPDAETGGDPAGVKYEAPDVGAKSISGMGLAAADDPVGDALAPLEDHDATGGILDASTPKLDDGGLDGGPDGSLDDGLDGV